MTDKLPPNLLALFAARPPLRWVDPPDYAPEKRKTAAIGSVAAFLPALQQYKETDQYTPTESWLEARDRKKREKKEAAEKLVTEGPKLCEHSLPREPVLQILTGAAADKPHEDPNIRGDSFKTLIVARLSYDADERDLEREFGRFGPIERVRVPIFRKKGIANILLDSYCHRHACARETQQEEEAPSRICLRCV